MYGGFLFVKIANLFNLNLVIRNMQQFLSYAQEHFIPTDVFTTNVM